MNCIFLFFKGQYLLLHKACVQVFLLRWILEWPSFLIFSGCDLAQPWSCLLPLWPRVYVCLFRALKWRSPSYYKKNRQMKEILTSSQWLLAWKQSDSFDTGGTNYCMSAYVSNTYNKWVRLIVIFSCSGASIFKVLWNKKGTIFILLLKWILMNSMTWAQTMKNTRLLDQTTNVTRIDRWQIVIERQTYITYFRAVSQFLIYFEEYRFSPKWAMSININSRRHFQLWVLNHQWTVLLIPSAVN